MSQVNPYASIEKRTFQNALIQMLESDYGLLGGRRILQILAEDVQELIEEFYPASERASSGDLIWTCTAYEGRKAEVGKRTEDYKTITVRLPLVTKTELQERTQKKTPRGKGRQRARERAKRRVVRLAKAAAEQGGVLTIAELSAIVNRSYDYVRKLLREWEDENDEVLPMKGAKMDQGSRPTHKGIIIRLFEQGKEPPDVAHETGHSLKSVERYLKDYERVKLLLKSEMSPKEIASIIGRGERVVLEYVKIIREYHPNLAPDAK